MKTTRLSKLTLSFLSLFSTASLAQNTPLPQQFTGFHIGLGLGVSSFFSKMSTTYELENFGVEIISPVSNSEASATKNGAMGQFLVGYGYVAPHNTYIGIEGMLSALASTKINFNNTYVTSDITRNMLEPSLDLRFGLLLTPSSLIYLQGGASYNRLKIDLHTPAQLAVGGGSRRVSTIGTQVGVGFEYMTSKHIGFAGNYTYEFYPSLSGGSSLSCESADGTLRCSQASAKGTQVSGQEALLQLIYHFS